MTKIQWEADIAECDQKLFLFSYIVKIMMSLSDNKSLAQSLQIFVITLRQLKKKDYLKLLMNWIMNISASTERDSQVFQYPFSKVLKITE